MDSKLKKWARDREVFSLVTVAVCLILFGLLVGCPIRLLTGVSCPGCGMTRAWRSVLTLNFPAAFHYHPLWPVPALFGIFYAFVRKDHPKAYQAFLIVSILLFVAVYVIRLTEHGDVVTVRFQDGLIYRILSRVFGTGS